MSLFNTDLLKIPWQHNWLINNNSYSLMYQISCRQGGGKQLNRFLFHLFFWILDWLVFLGTTYWWRNWSDQMMKNSISCGPRPAVSKFSDKTRQGNNMYQKETPPQQYQQKFCNFCLQEEGSDVIDRITSPSTIHYHFLNSYSTQSQLIKICPVERNLASCILLPNLHINLEWNKFVVLR